MTTTVERLAGLVRDTLALGTEVEVRGDQLLFHDLGFTSIDLLDLLFRIEEHFGVAIVEGTIYRLARGDLDDALFASKAVLTPLGRERVMALLSDTPAAMFPERLDAPSLPRYVTVGALARLIDHLTVARQGG